MPLIVRRLDAFMTYNEAAWLNAIGRDDEARALDPPAEVIEAEVAMRPESTILFRLGERCNHGCPMCTNTGRPELDFIGRAHLGRMDGRRRPVNAARRR